MPQIPLWKRIPWVRLFFVVHLNLSVLTSLWLFPSLTAKACLDFELTSSCIRFICFSSSFGLLYSTCCRRPWASLWFVFCLRIVHNTLTHCAVSAIAAGYSAVIAALVSVDIWVFHRAISHYQYYKISMAHKVFLVLRILIAVIFGGASIGVSIFFVVTKTYIADIVC